MKISTQYIVLIVTLLIAMTLGAIGLNYIALNSALNDRQKAWAGTLVSSISEGLALDIIERRQLRLRYKLERIADQNADVLYAFVTDFNGTVLAHSFHDGFPREALPDSRALQSVANDARIERSVMVDGIDVMDIAFPIVKGMGARMHLGINEAGNARTLSKTTKLYALFAASICLVGLVISIWLGRRFALPLQQLTENISDYGDDDITPTAVDAAACIEAQKLQDNLMKMFLARKAAAAELARFKHALDHTLDMIFMFDSQTLQFTYLNEGAVLSMGYTREEMLQLHPYDIKPMIPREKFRELIAPILSGDKTVLEFDTVHRRKDGSDMPVSIVLQIARDARGPDRFVAVARDITDRKRTENEIRQLNASLERRIEERSTDLLRAQQKIIQSEKMAALGGLVAGVAHEINTPVGVGVTAASHLQAAVHEASERYHAGHLTRNAMDEFLRSAAEASKILLTNLKRAAELTRSFKQVAVDQSSEAQRPFHLKAYLEEVLLSLSPTLRKACHEVKIECPPELQINSRPGAFSQVISNLVMNSIAHGFENMAEGHITIAASVDPDGLLLRYADDGKGIPSENIGRIFEPFYTTRRGQGGTGLGLHIVYNIITQTLGGSISCSSIPGQGVDFEIRIPHSAPLNNDAAEGEAAVVTATV